MISLDELSMVPAFILAISASPHGVGNISTGSGLADVALQRPTHGCQFGLLADRIQVAVAETARASTAGVGRFPEPGFNELRSSL